MTHMRVFLRLVLALGAVSIFSASLSAQSTPGAIDLSAHVTPTGAEPEPVRQFPFFVLTKSYADVVKEVEGQDALPTRDKFIDGLKCSPELKTWLKAHDQIDLTSPDLDKSLSVDDIMNISEFFTAYESSNSGGVTKGFPLPKYRETDKNTNPEKYKREHAEFLAATRKFLESHPGTVQGIELELMAVNPKALWDNMHATHAAKMSELAPDTAQVKYLAAKAQTDLNGHALITGLAPGTYWVSTLGSDASSGDRHLAWDVTVTVLPGQATHIELSNLNAVETRKLAAARP
jgi:hypothetical protein